MNTHLIRLFSLTIVSGKCDQEKCLRNLNPLRLELQHQELESTQKSCLRLVMPPVNPSQAPIQANKPQVKPAPKEDLP